MSDDMYRIIISLLNKKTNNLTIAHDENQNIYKREHPWKDIGIQAVGRVHRISYIYRNTIEITGFASKFIGGESENEADSKHSQLELFPDLFDFHGPVPEIKKFSGFNDILKYTADKILALVNKYGLPFSEIAILYPVKAPIGMPDVHLPQMIENELEAKGIICDWSAEDYRSKRSYDITTNSVTISTIHSVKGLDYSCVFLVGMDYMENKRWSKEQQDKLTYVAITRARHQLYIPFINECFLITQLKECV